MKSHFLQSKAWKQFQEDLGREVFELSGKGWKTLAVLEIGTLNRRIYCPYGPVFEDEKSLDSAITSLLGLAKEKNADFLRIEPRVDLPDNFLQQRGFKKVNYQQLQPAHTQIIDLTDVSEEELVANFAQNNRSIYRNHHKKGYRIEVSQDPEDVGILVDFMQEVASRNGISVHESEYYKKQAESLTKTGSEKIYIARLDDGTPIAAGVFFDGEGMRVYAHAAADDKYRKLSAGTALLSTAIVDAKKSGLTEVDLYGIAPDGDKNHPWDGFSKFKKSFGGKSFEYAGAWDLPINKARYWMYRFYQKIR